eukprot:8162697-Alexandrium_andersonii.AAC.1
MLRLAGLFRSPTAGELLTTPRDRQLEAEAGGWGRQSPLLQCPESLPCMKHGPKVETAAALNNSLAKPEKGPNSHVERAAGHSRPAGRHAFVPSSQAANAGDPFLQFWEPGAPRE